MAEFHETMYGKRYYEHQLPELTRQLQRIADSLEKIVTKIEEADEHSSIESDFRGEDL